MILVETTEVVNQAQDYWQMVKDYFNPQTITSITAVILMLVSLLKLVSMVKTLNKQKAMTIPNLLAELKKYVDEIKDNEIKKAVNTIVEPLVMQVGAIVPVLDVFCKIQALSQENTPESRVAVLKLIQELGKIELQPTLDEAKETIETEVQEKEQKKQEVEEIIQRPIE